MWRPQAGSQALFLASPIYETGYTGTRGPGKTDALLMDFAQHCGRGSGEHWRGILFRRTYKQLADVVAKSKKWFYRIFPGIRFNEGDFVWTWPGGEQLLLRYMRVPGDYENYHGHEYPWIGWEELTNWPDLKCYDLMKSCSRSSFPGMPRKYRWNCNPYGVGHNAVKMRMVDPAPPGVVVTDPETGLQRVRISGHYSENRALLAADPDYPAKIAAAARNEQEKQAWLDENWDIVAGGMLDDVWRQDVHVLRGRSAWPPAATPSSWRIDRAFDWGSTKPFSVGWWAESDGTEAPNGQVYPRGTLIRIAEWYGWDGKTPNVGLRLTNKAIGQGIKEREEAMGIRDRMKPGPADSSIFVADPGKKSIADEIRKYGVKFVEADKRPGSRKAGWEALRERLESTMDRDREQPWILIFEACRQWIRTVPTLPRSDKDPDDVDTEAEDHAGDETRYRVKAPRREARTFEHRV